MKKALFILVSLLINLNLSAHEHDATATYLGNEGVMIHKGDIKVVFDPFFHNNYNNYQLVPEEIREAIFSNTAPYDAIDVIFISHAHGDHFAADDVLKYLLNNTQTKLIAPAQAIDKIKNLKGYQPVIKQMIAINLNRDDKPKIIHLNKILIEAVRIPHAGWPARADVSNLVFRVTLDEKVTIMHMGDADPNDVHFKPYKKYWDKQKTNTAFPPYWFFTSSDGPIILDERINSDTSIGLHVPVKVPESLKMTDEKYFSVPGEQSSIEY